MIPNRADVNTLRSRVIEMKGGVDEHAPELQMPPGSLGTCVNYMIAEGSNGGYISTAGFERIDGEGKPSDIPTVVLTVRDETVTEEGPVEEYTLYNIKAGDTILGATGAATALTDGVIDSIHQRVEIAIITDSFNYYEELFVLASSIGIHRGIASLLPTEDFHTAWETRRLEVLPVPGEGPVLGLTLFKGDAYAWRKASGLAKILMYKMDAVTGWVEIVPPIGEELNYISDDEHSFEFTVHNFYGGTTAIPHLTSEESLFFVDGANKARYYNATEGIVIIDNVGMLGDDKPQHLSIKDSYLFLSYRGGSLQHSGVGDPLEWTTGTGEFGLGKEITALKRGVGGDLLIFMENGITQLIGNTVAEWVLKDFSRESGAFSKTVQRMLGTMFFMDDRGLTTLEAVEFHGDYAANTVSTKFKNTLLSNKSKYTNTVVNRDLNQYRMYFNDGLGIIVSFQGKELQGATFTEFPISVDKITSGTFGEDTSAILFATNLAVNKAGEDIAGMVFKMDSGMNFDKEAILTQANTAYYHYGQPRLWKRFVSCMVEARTTNNLSYNFKVDYDYHESALPNTQWLSGTTGASTNVSFRYGDTESRYGEAILGSAVTTFRQPIYLMGYGTNASLQWTTRELWTEPHTVQNIIMDYQIHRRRV